MGSDLRELLGRRGGGRLWLGWSLPRAPRRAHRQSRHHLGDRRADLRGQALVDLAHELQRRAVLSRDRGRQALDAAIPRRVRESPREQAAEALALQCVADGDRDLGGGRIVGVANEAADGDDALWILVVGNSGDRVVVPPVDLRQVAELARRERRLGPEEATLPALLGKTLHARKQPFLVVRTDLAEEEEAVVGEAGVHEEYAQCRPATGSPLW